jgi:hypothetical protein
VAAKKIYLFESLSSEGALHIGEIGSALILWGLLCIILLTLLSFSFSMQLGGQVAYQDFSLMEEGLIGWNIGFDQWQAYPPSFPSAIFTLILFQQYLRSHIGEKRPSDNSSRLTNSLIGVQTARFYRAVFYLCPRARLLARRSGKTQIFDQRRIMVLHEFFQPGLLAQKLMIRGGLQPCVEL